MYAGNSGTDFNLGVGINILSAADGYILDTFFDWEENGPTGCGNYVVINHLNGYLTRYCHLNTVYVVNNENVNSGEIIGTSGRSGTINPHLHFEVFYGPSTDLDYITDPFGWVGSYQDPLINWPSNGQGYEALCLWRSSFQDPISCDDVWIQDGGEGFGYFDDWFIIQNYGNGFHVTTSFNVNDPNQISWWNPPVFRSGLFKVYAYIPLEPIASQEVQYAILTSEGWVYVILDQTAYPDHWNVLGTYILPADTFIVVYAQTTEIEYTRIVVADDVKFRSFPIFLPNIMK